MANPLIPVPGDLAFVRDGPDTGNIVFTSVDDMLEYDVRFGPVPEFWNEAFAVLVGPYPAGTVLKIPVSLEGLVPDETSPPTYFFIVSKNALGEFSPVSPPPEGVALTDPGNWGQGGLRYDWQAWVPPVPEPEPIPDPIPVPDPTPDPVPDPTPEPVPTTTTTTVRAVKLWGPIALPPLGTFYVYKEVPNA